MTSRMTTLVALSALWVGSCNASVAGVSPDLNVAFTCGSVPSERQIGGFLTERDFEFVNVGWVQRQYGVAIQPLEIEAYKGDQQVLVFSGIDWPATPGMHPKPAYTSYYVSVYSVPPTRHDDRLEAAAISFVRDKLGCHIDKIERWENPGEAKASFDAMLSIHQNRIKEARFCDKTGSQFDPARCPTP